MKKPPEPTFFQRWQNQFICLAIALATFAIYSEVSEFQFVNFDDSLYSLNPHNRQGLSAFSALVFAVHLLHVESVAWASERKDVLWAVFWFLTLWAWVSYTVLPPRIRYLRALGFFCLGLMSKPMMVSLPVIMFLLDFWPLRPWSGRTLLEKVPFAALCVAASGVTFFAQQAGGAVQSIEKIGLAPRIENALVSWVIYLLKAIWPTDLGVFYPLARWTAAQAALCGLTLAALTAVVFWRRAKFPWLVTGWFWYLVTTLPVIGLVQVGEQSHADRYMYIPMVRITMAVAWSVRELMLPRPQAMGWVAGATAALIVALSGAARAHAYYWRGTQTLFRHTVDVTEGNAAAYELPGAAFLRQRERVPEAVAAFRQVVRIRPESAVGHTYLAGALDETDETGHTEEAMREAQIALRLDPDLWRGHLNLGSILQHQGQTEQAITEMRTAIRLNHRVVEPHASFGAALLAAGRMREALAEEEEALGIDPDLSADPKYAPAHEALGRVLLEIPGRLLQSYPAGCFKALMSCKLLPGSTPGLKGHGSAWRRLLRNRAGWQKPSSK